MRTYQESIRDWLNHNGYIGRYDPRHIEAFMRLEHGCLDGLTKTQWADEIRIGMGCVDCGGVEGAESCAKSFGL